MNTEDYSKYYIQGSDHYLIPKDVFDELNEQLDKYENPEDMTLMMMWCTEKVKDENEKLNKKYLNAVADYETTMSDKKELEKQLEELELIIGLRQKRNLISKFDKEYDEEDKKKNPNRDYAGIMPDAEEVYKRYYSMKKQQKKFVEYMNKTIEELESDDADDEEMKGYLIQSINTFKEILSKYKSIIGGKDVKNIFE